MNSSIHCFRAVRRPAGMNSPYELAVVDGKGFPHHPLTVFYHKLHQALSDGAAHTYLNSVLAFFSYLAADTWRQQRGDQWDSPPADVQEAVRDYLVYRLGCKIQPRETYALVALTAQSPSTVRVFLAAIKQFYRIMCREGMYTYTNPLIDVTTRLLREIENEEGMQRHRMPRESGVEEPITDYQSENFFRLAKEQWEVHPVDDPDLAKHLVIAFKIAKLSLRDQIVIRIAFESGARIREILTLTVGDWRDRGCHQEARARSKGSRGRRVKTIRFSDTTAKMLRQYLNTDRTEFDLERRRLEQLSDCDPLFLSQRRNPFDYEAFKPRWKKLCQAAKISIRIHDLRHWYTTMAIRTIAQTAQTSAEITLRKEELVRYMAWRSPDTMKTYDRYFKGIQHYVIQDQIHQNLEESVTNYVEESAKENQLIKQNEQKIAKIGSISETTKVAELQVKQDMTGWGKLLALGGKQ